MAGFSYAALDLTVGSTTDGSLKADDMYMCHSAVLRDELSAAQVAALYDTTAPKDLSATYPGAEISHWCSLGDECFAGAGACPDLSDHGNDGTSGGGMLDADFRIADVPP